MGSAREAEGLRLYGAASARVAELQTTMADEVTFWMNFRERYVPPARKRIGATPSERQKESGVRWVGKKLSLARLNSPPGS